MSSLQVVLRTRPGVPTVPPGAAKFRLHWRDNFRRAWASPSLPVSRVQFVDWDGAIDGMPPVAAVEWLKK